MISNYKSKILALILSIRPETTPISILTVFIGGLIAGASYDSIPLLLALFVTFFITAGGMTFNDAYDWKIDKINHPNRPIPKGIINQKQMFQFTFILLLSGLIISFFINLICVGIVILSILFIAIYEVYTKEYGLIGNITVAFISSITFIFGGAAVNNPLASVPLTLIAFLIIFSREIIMDIRDIEGDKKHRQTLPNKIGIRRSSYICSFFLFLAIILSPIPYLLNLVNIWYFYMIIPTNILIFITVIWFLKDHKNAGLTAHLIRGELALGLIGFIFGII